MESASKYFYAKGEEQIGPHSLAEIESKIRDGEIKPDTKIWTKGMADWLPAKSVKIVANLFDEIPPKISSEPLSKEQVKNLNASSFLPILSSFGLFGLAIKNWRDAPIGLIGSDLTFTSILYPFIVIGGIRWMSARKNHELNSPILSSLLFCITAFWVSVALVVMITSIITLIFELSE
jgi:hypothetical protein